MNFIQENYTLIGILLVIIYVGTDDIILERDRRNLQLLYPNVTLLQLNIGVATPTPIKTIFYNWVLQANFNLPWNRTQIPVDIFGANNGYVGNARKKREVESSVHTIYFDERDNLRNVEEIERHNNVNYNPLEDYCKLYHVYKHVEHLLDDYGYNGATCVRRALCQIAAEPLYATDDEDLLHEIASFIFNPKHDKENGELAENDDANQFIEAYERGLQTGSEDCLKKYDGCSLSLLDMFSVLH